jgi:hypothetical protein
MPNADCQLLEGVPIGNRQLEIGNLCNLWIRTKKVLNCRFHYPWFDVQLESRVHPEMLGSPLENNKGEKQCE